MSETFDKSQMSETIDVPAGCYRIDILHSVWIDLITIDFSLNVFIEFS